VSGAGKLSENQLAVLRTVADPRGETERTGLDFYRRWGGTRRARAWWGGLESLERRGLVRRNHDPRRALPYDLTDAGRALLATEARS